MTDPAGGALRFARFLLAGKPKTQKARQEVRLRPLRGRNLPHVVAHGATPNHLKGDAHKGLPLRVGACHLIFRNQKKWHAKVRLSPTWATTSPERRPHGRRQ